MAGDESGEGDRHSRHLRGDGPPRNDRGSALEDADSRADRRRDRRGWTRDLGRESADAGNTRTVVSRRPRFRPSEKPADAPMRPAVSTPRDARYTAYLPSPKLFVRRSAATRRRPSQPRPRSAPADATPRAFCRTSGSAMFRAPRRRSPARTASGDESRLAARAGRGGAHGHSATPVFKATPPDSVAFEHIQTRRTERRRARTRARRARPRRRASRGLEDQHRGARPISSRGIRLADGIAASAVAAHANVGRLETTLALGETSRRVGLAGASRAALVAAAGGSRRRPPPERRRARRRAAERPAVDTADVNARRARGVFREGDGHRAPARSSPRADPRSRVRCRRLW